MRNELKIALAAFVALSLAPVTARAFCRTTTGGLEPGCTIEGTKCCSIGPPLFWRNACVGYSLQQDASNQVSLPEATARLGNAFAKWTGTTCTTGAGAPGKVGIQVQDNGPVSCTEVRYNTDGPNQHLIVFRDKTWDHSDATNTLALTTMTFEPTTGEIYDADMEINTALQRVTLNDPVPPRGFDFDSIVTHEAGHFLGLAHSPDKLATMFEHYEPGTTSLRNLTADDASGLCDAYPADGTRTGAGEAPAKAEACDATPRHGFTKVCAVPTTTKSGCSFAPASAWGSAGTGASAVPLAFSLLALARRRRDRRRAGDPER